MRKEEIYFWGGGGGGVGVGGGGGWGGGGGGGGRGGGGVGGVGGGGGGWGGWGGGGGGGTRGVSREHTQTEEQRDQCRGEGPPAKTATSSSPHYTPEPSPHMHV